MERVTYRCDILFLRFLVFLSCIARICMGILSRVSLGTYSRDGEFKNSAIYIEHRHKDIAFYKFHFAIQFLNLI